MTDTPISTPTVHSYQVLAPEASTSGGISGVTTGGEHVSITVDAVKNLLLGDARVEIKDAQEHVTQAFSIMRDGTIQQVGGRNPKVTLAAAAALNLDSFLTSAVANATHSPTQAEFDRIVDVIHQTLPSTLAAAAKGPAR